MSTRMEKYYEEEDTFVPSRVSKHSELYKEINKTELENFSIKSNESVIGSHENEIDVEKIKRILDTKYNDHREKSRFKIEDENEEEVNLEDTKEYDINVILEKAKEEKTDNYEDERLKKLRDTQFDILKNLNLDIEKEEDNSEEDLQNLINTIALNEKQSKKIQEGMGDPLDILDLKGDDNTEVLNGLKEEVNEEKDMDTKMINSFYTSSNKILEKDFEDVDDFAKDVESSNTFIKVGIVIIVIIFLVGIAYLLKTLYFS